MPWSPLVWVGLAAGVLLVCPGPRAQEAPSSEWPQFGGPLRDFQAAPARLGESWPADGPPRVWQRSLGEGYSGIAAVGTSLYTMYRRGGEEVVVALDAATGSILWQHAEPVVPLAGMNLEQGPGPHATPLVHQGLVFAVGATGRLRALDAAKGTLRWQRRLIEDLGGTVVFRGYSSSPTMFRGTVIVQSGGQGHALTAFAAATGAIVWRGGSFANVNSSPVVADVAGETHVVALGAGEVVGVDATSGASRWAHPHPHRFGENIPMPLWSDRQLFVSSYADGGSRMLEFDRAAGRIGVRQRWHHTRMRLYYTNAVRLGTTIYGSSGDLGPTVFTAVDAATGEVRWQSRDIARSSLIAVGDRLLLRDDEGRLVLARPADRGVSILASATLLSAGPPSPPTLAGTRAFVRDRHSIMALELR